MSDIAAVQDWREADIRALTDQVLEARAETDKVQRELRDVVRERDWLATYLREAARVMRREGLQQQADDLCKAASYHIESFGDDDE